MKIKKFLLCILLLIPVSVYSLDYPKINSKIAQVYDLTDEKVLYEKKANNVVPVASLTKIATALVAIENIKDLEKKVVITSNILNTINPALHVVGLKVGAKVTYRDLLYGTIVSSGADAANALAILSSGSISNHVEKMNNLVKEIGLQNTHFSDVTGLDNKNDYSTADEIRKLLTYALKNSLFKEIYTTKKYTMTNGLVVNTTLKLYDKRGAVDTSFIIGSKTGFTYTAGYCLAYLIDVNGHNFIVVTLNASRNGNNYYNLIDANTLVKFMKKNYQEEILVKKGKIIKELPVNLSNIDSYVINSTSDVKKYLPSDYDINKLKIEYSGLEELSYKNKENDKIGEILYYFDNELLTKQDVILNQKINLNIIKLLKKYYLLVAAGLCLIISLSVLFIKKRLRQNKRKKIALRA